MTKKLLSTAGLIALLTFAPGCGDERDNPGAEQQQQELSETPIGFSGNWWNDDNNPASRATAILDAAGINQMAVYAHYTGTENFSTVSSTSQPDVMMGQLVELKNGSWTYTPLRYWPTGQQMISFFGITYGHTGDNGVAPGPTGGGTYTGAPSFRVTPPSDPSKQKDIGVAYALNRTQADGPVPLSFTHAMHKVNFSAKYTTGTTVDGTSWLGDNGYLKVSKIEFGNVSAYGTLNIIPASDEGNDFSWTGVETTKSAAYTILASDGELVSSNLLLEGTAADAAYMISTAAGTLMLVPQQDAEPYVTLTTDVYDGYGNMRQSTHSGTLQQADWNAGESTTYNFSLNIKEDIYCWGFNYTGKVRTFIVPQDGAYKLEVWGAKGNDRPDNRAAGGNGAYAAGEINLKKDQVLYIYAGSQGATFNGGAVYNLNANAAGGGGGGGGATDIRLAGGNWDNATSLNSRILVAAGGGGFGSNAGQGRYFNGGAGGGLTGYDGSAGDGSVAGRGGTQTAGGAAVASGYTSEAGSFGKGGRGNSDTGVGGGGSGYYGASGSARQGNSYSAGSAGGGSSFVSGMTGCVAIVPTATNNPRTRDTGTTNTTALNYTESVFGTSPTWNDGDEIEFSNYSMIDGQGYQWNTGAKAGSATGIPTKPPGGNNGYARITLLPTTP